MQGKLIPESRVILALRVQDIVEGPGDVLRGHLARSTLDDPESVTEVLDVKRNFIPHRQGQPAFLPFRQALRECEDLIAELQEVRLLLGKAYGPFRLALGIDRHGGSECLEELSR